MPTPTVHSNAFNFLSHVQAGVDPRTGQYSCSISLPELKANQLCGPIVPLTLGFDPMSPRDTGFGKGWSLRLSHFDTVSRILSLSTGETFRIAGPDSQPTVPERKIDSFHFSIDADVDADAERRYRVVHKSGLVEILTLYDGDTQAWVTEVQAAEGHRVSLRYGNYAGETALLSVSDAYGMLLEIARPNTTLVNIDLHPGQGVDGAPLARFSLVLDSREVRRIELPTDNRAGWRFDYDTIRDYLCIVELHTPLGGHELISYDSQGHEFPNNLYPSLPRVELHEQRPGAGQPAVQVRYRYSNENFLGFGASGLIWDDDGLDNLYRADAGYIYSSTEQLWVDDQALRTTVRAFNHFHLLTEETVTQRDNVLRTRTTYHAKPGLSFDQQPPQCQLPDVVQKLWYHPSASSQTHEQVTRTTFDVFGNLLTQENPDGTLETRRYYPAAGGDGCPPDPHGFERTLQDSTLTPVATAPGDAPVLRTAYRYALQTGVNGATPGWLAMTDQVLLQVQGSGETELQRSAFGYFDQPADPYLHGRKQRDTQTLNGCSTFTDYAYRRTRNTRTGQAVQHTEVSLSTDFDAVRKTYTLQHSLLNGQPLLNRDDNDVEIAYRYDVLGRVTEETVAPDTPYEATRRYAYRLSTADGQPAEQTVTNVKGLQTRTLLDGANRVVEEWRQGADDNAPEDEQKTYSARYDARGLLVQDTTFDWLPEAGTLHELPLTSTYRYDDWGEQCSVTGADGVSRIAETDPVRQTLRSWVQSNGTPPQISNLTETRNNRFGKPEWNKTLDASGNLVAQTDYTYDGLGRCIQEVNAFGNSTLFTYDPWSRVTSTTLPDLTLIGKDYAPHSNEALPTKLHVGAGSAAAPILLGEQQFDGLDRTTQVKVGPRLTAFVYKGGQMQVDQCITPSNRSIQYHYTLGLTDQPIRTVAEDEQADFTYDFKTASLMSSENGRSRTEFDYSLNGQLKAERLVEAGVTWETRYLTSLAGRAVSRQDPSGLTSLYEYDHLGRLESIRQEQLQAEFTWSSLGRLERTLTTDMANGSTLQTNVQYNDQGQETERTLALTGQDTRTITQTWRKDGKLNTRHLQTQGRSLLHETFEYDRRGRLVLHACTGETLPQDRYGHGISEQGFDFDALDNITQVRSLFADGSTDLALFSFAPDDPTQLVNVTHTHPGYPASITLDYDADGNLMHDENAQRLTYDMQSRLLGVTATDGTPTAHYRYDAHNQLVGVRRDGQGEALRFYQGERLSSSVHDNRTTSYLYGGGQPLGQQTLGDEAQSLLFMTDAKHSLLGESQQGDLRTAVYSAYGERSSDDNLRSLLGFNGEVRDEVSGWYLLGRGYRAYNPTLMRFHSPDSLSPFGAGGLNPYVYCLGDPIGLVDPTGHMSRGLFLGLNIVGFVLGVIGTVATGGLVAPALTAQFGLFAVAQTAGVAAMVTGGVGIITPDLQAKKVLGWTSFALGIVSMVVGISTLVGGSSKWLGKGAEEATDVVSDVERLGEFFIPRPSVNAPLSSSSVQAAGGQIDDVLTGVDMRMFNPGTVNASTRTPRPGVLAQTSTAPPPPPMPSQPNAPAVVTAPMPTQVNTSGGALTNAGARSTQIARKASDTPELIAFFKKAGTQFSANNKFESAGDNLITISEIRGL